MHMHVRNLPAAHTLSLATSRPLLVLPSPPSDGVLLEAPRRRSGPLVTPTVAKGIAGQAALQLGVLAALLGPLGEAAAGAGGRPAQLTIVFNAFVCMCLANQVCGCC
jgi:hypothetical protein